MYSIVTNLMRNSNGPTARRGDMVNLLFYGICLETSVWLLYYGGVPKKPLMVASFIAGILMAYGLVEIIWN